METLKLSPLSEISFEVVYPEENPRGYMEDITKVMAHIGLFDGLDKKVLTNIDKSGKSVTIKPDNTLNEIN